MAKLIPSGVREIVVEVGRYSDTRDWYWQLIARATGAEIDGRNGEEKSLGLAIDAAKTAAWRYAIKTQRKAKSGRLSDSASSVTTHHASPPSPTKGSGT